MRNRDLYRKVGNFIRLFKQANPTDLDVRVQIKYRTFHVEFWEGSTFIDSVQLSVPVERLSGVQAVQEVEDAWRLIQFTLLQRDYGANYLGSVENPAHDVLIHWGRKTR